MKFINTSGRHNKYYVVSMLETPIDDTWIVFAEWGSISTKIPNRQEKARGGFQHCQKIFNGIIKKRLKNGYIKDE